MKSFSNIESDTETFSVVEPSDTETDYGIVRLDKQALASMRITPGEFVYVGHDSHETIVQCWVFLNDERDEDSVVMDEYVQSNVHADTHSTVYIAPVSVDDVAVANEVVLSVSDENVETLSRLAEEQLLNTIVKQNEQLPISTSKTYVATRETDDILQTTVEHVDADTEMAMIRDRTVITIE